MSTPPFGVHPNPTNPAQNVSIPPYASNHHLLPNLFHSVPNRFHHGHGAEFSASASGTTLGPGDVSLGAYRHTPDPAANREDSRRASTYAIQIPERIHRGAVHRASADDALHELRAIPSSSSRGEGAFVAGESTNTSPAAMPTRSESSMAAGSATLHLHEFSSYWHGRIDATHYGPSPASSRPFTGSSRLGREVSAEVQSRSAENWLQRTMEPTASITPPDLYPPNRSYAREITSSQSPEGGHVSSAGSGSDSSGTPSAARPIPIAANPPRNWEDEYAFQHPIQRDARVANEDAFGGVVTVPVSPSSFPHPQAAIQCDPGPFVANPYPENPSSWNTQSNEKVQIGRDDTFVTATSSLSSYFSGPSTNTSTSTDTSSGGGFGTNTYHHRITLPTPVPFGQNPSSNPLPRRPLSSSESSAEYLSGPASTPPPTLPQGTPTIASPASVLALGTRAPASSPTQPPPKSSAARGPRKKTHGCWMCHKSFDRPSTLKKHLLVHTGEKAFVCQFCNRRFGVASNLNRHIKRCPQRPKDASALAGPSPKSPLAFVGSSQPASTICTLNLGLREQVPFSESAPFDFATSTQATISTLSLQQGLFPSSSSASSFYVYPDSSQTSSMTRSPVNPMHSNQGSRQRARTGRTRNNQPPSPSRQLSASAPDLPSLLSDGTRPVRRPHSSSRSPTERAQQAQGAVSNAELGVSREGTQQDTEKPRKRARRPPSPPTWVPESLANFEFYPAPAITRACPCPLPPVKPIVNPLTGAYVEERDSFASTLAAIIPPGTSDDESSSDGFESDHDSRAVGAGNDENAEPRAGGAFDASSRAREREQARANRAAAKEARARARLALYAPYHPIGFSGVLPGPAVVLGTGPEGDAVIERAPIASGSGSGITAGDMVGADMTNLRFEMFTGRPSEDASGPSSSGGGAL